MAKKIPHSANLIPGHITMPVFDPFGKAIAQLVKLDQDRVSRMALQATTLAVEMFASAFQD